MVQSILHVLFYNVTHSFHRSLILTDSGKIYCFGGGSRKLQELDLGAAPADASDDEEDGSPQSIAFAGADVIALAVKSTDLPVSNFKSVEKLFLKKLCAIFYQVRSENITASI